MNRLYGKLPLAALICLVALGCDSTSSPGVLTRATLPTSPSAAPARSGILAAGLVTDTAYRYLTGVRVEVVDGLDAGLSTLTDHNGRFHLQGRFEDTTRFRASKDGHIDQTVSLLPACATCSNSTRYLSFSLPVVTPSIEMGGSYTLSIQAHERCDLPEAVRSREYLAVLAAAPGRPMQYAVIVAGARAGYDQFGLGIAGDYIAGWLGHDGPFVIEQLTPETFVAFDGTFDASSETAVGDTVNARLDGVISYCSSSSEPGSRRSCANLGVLQTECRARDHRLTLTRR